MENCQQKIARIEEELGQLKKQVNDYHEKSNAAYNAGNYSIASSFEAAARSLAAAVEDREARLHYFREHNYEGE
jgi:phage shock protein A